MSQPIPAEQHARVAAERDLFLDMLEFGGAEGVEPFVRQALTRIVPLLGVQRGYLEIFEPNGDDVRWSASHCLTESEVDEVRDTISRGIVAEAMASGELVVTVSALLDGRFAERESVLRNEIEAVLCAPIEGEGVRGVLYLAGRTTPGLFPESDQKLAELFTRHLAPLARRMLALQRAREIQDPTRELRDTLRLENVVGQSEALANVLRQVALVAPLGVTVLLTGESGTGKSMFARVIHDNGPRASAPFVELNCAAFQDTLIESELFGAVPGGHSTATRRVIGKVTAAEGGTLFLDEIALLSPQAQAKLLQLLQSRVYYPIGSPTPLQANVRVIAATNADLEQAVSEGRFREDLFYRLNVVPLRIPSLAERRTDLGALSAHLIQSASARDGLPSLPLSRNAVRALEATAWPGNVRQLANILEAALIRAAGERAEQLEPNHLFPVHAANGRAAGPATESLQGATRGFQREFVGRVLRECNWNIVEAAKRLDVARSYVYTLIRALDLESERQR